MRGSVSLLRHAWKSTTGVNETRCHFSTTEILVVSEIFFIILELGPSNKKWARHLNTPKYNAYLLSSVLIADLYLQSVNRVSYSFDLQLDQSRRQFPFPWSCNHPYFVSCSQNFTYVYFLIMQLFKKEVTSCLFVSSGYFPFMKSNQ